MIRPEDYFEDLLMRVIEGCATGEERVTFAEIIRRDPELRARYIREMRFHAILSFQDESDGQTAKRKSLSGFSISWRAAAAAVVALALGAAMWKAEKIRRSENLGFRSSFRVSRSESREISDTPVAPTLVRLEEAVSAEGLYPSKTGVWNRASELRLKTGRARFRLVSGAEVTLLGPAELSLRDGMEVTLVSGACLQTCRRRRRGSRCMPPD
jgi:hypothetical protein